MLRNWLIISAEILGIKETLPPYLEPTLEIEDLLTGVSFASAGSGYDPVTAEVAVIITLLSHIIYFLTLKISILFFTTVFSFMLYIRQCCQQRIN